MFHFVIDATEYGVVGKRILVWKPMEPVPFDHATPSYGEDAWRIVKDQRSGIGSKGTNVESNLLLFTGRELPIGRAQRELATARPHEVLAKLDVATVDEINSRPRVEHKPPHPASARTIAWLDLGGCSPDRTRWYVNKIIRPPGHSLQTSGRGDRGIGLVHLFIGINFLKHQVLRGVPTMISQVSKLLFCHRTLLIIRNRTGVID
jgi:hypothetical protein